MSARQVYLVLSCALGMLAPGRATAQDSASVPVDTARLTLARRLLTAMHYRETMLAGVETALKEQRTNGQMPAVFYDSLLARMQRTAPEAMDSIAPAYARRFTCSELTDLVRFFESPTGQRLASEQSPLGIEENRFGQRWGARVAAAVVKDLVDAGIDITKP